MHTRFLGGLTVICSLLLLAMIPLRAAEGPSIQILQPLGDQEIRGPQMPLALSFKSDVTVLRCDAYIDSNWILGLRITNPICEGSLPIPESDRPNLAEMKISPGVHRLTITATDSRGNVGKAEMKITYRPQISIRTNTPPRVRIVEPKNGDVITKATQIKVQADDDNGIKWVMIYVNGKMRSMMNEAPFTIPWNPFKDKVLLDTYTLRADALNLLDLRSSSPEIIVRINKARTSIDKPPVNKSVDGPWTGLTLTRQPLFYSQPSFVSQLVGMLLPTPFTPRADFAAVAGGGMSTFSPAKLFPTFNSGIALAPNAIGLATAPKLAMPGVMQPVTLTGGGISSMRVEALLLQPGTQAVDRDRMVETPGLLIASIPAKSMPGGTISAGTARGAVTNSLGITPVNAAATRPSLDGMDIAQRGDIGLPMGNDNTRVLVVEQVKIAYVPSSLQKLTPSGAAAQTYVVTPTMAQHVQPNRGDAAARQTLLGPSAIASVRSGAGLPTGIAGKPGSRGTGSDSPVLIAMVPSLDKQTPTATTPASITDHASVRTATQPAQTAGVSTKLTPKQMSISGAPVIPDVQSHIAVAPSTGISIARSASTAPEMRAYGEMPAGTAISNAARPLNTDLPHTAAATLSTAKAAPRTGEAAPRDLLPILASSNNIQPELGDTAPQAHSTGMAVERPESMAVVEVPYVVTKPMTLRQIAMVHKTSPEELMKMNPGISPDRLIDMGKPIIVPKSNARIYLDATPVAGGPNPYVTNGFSMIPFRQLVEAKGGVVVWLPKTKEVNAWANNTYLGITVGKREARLNSEIYVLPVTPALRADRTMVPLRYLMAALKLQVNYNPSTGTYYLISQAAE
ncbi:MAG: stalk domain-containing protein [Armatimonadota bacterium]